MMGTGQGKVSWEVIYRNQVPHWLDSRALLFLTETYRIQSESSRAQVPLIPFICQLKRILHSIRLIMSLTIGDFYRMVSGGLSWDLI